LLGKLQANGHKSEHRIIWLLAGAALIYFSHMSHTL